MDGGRGGDGQTKVLCFFRYFARTSRAVGAARTDALMISVERAREIPDAFHATMEARAETWNDQRIGPKPIAWEMLTYVTEHGAPTF